MPRDPRLYLEDIVEAAGRILEYTRGSRFEQFCDDKRTVDAVVRNLEIIGEAARSLPDDLKQSMSDVEWQKISGLRNILVHEYFGINATIIWDIVQSKLASLESACLTTLRRLG